MRILKQSLVFVGLVGVLQFFREPEPVPSQALGIPAASVTSVRVSWADARSVFERDGSTPPGFELVGPPEAVAEESALGERLDRPAGPSFLGLASDLPPSRRRAIRMERDLDRVLTALTRTGVVMLPGRGPTPGQTGLDAPVGTLEIQTPQGVTGLAIGDVTPVGTGRYFHRSGGGPIGILPLSVTQRIERLARRAFGQDMF